MAKRKTGQRGTKGTLASGNQSEKEISRAGGWGNATFRGERDGKPNTSRESERDD